VIIKPYSDVGPFSGIPTYDWRIQDLEGESFDDGDSSSFFCFNYKDMGTVLKNSGFAYSPFCTT